MLLRYLLLLTLSLPYEGLSSSGDDSYGVNDFLGEQITDEDDNPLDFVNEKSFSSENENPFGFEDEDTVGFDSGDFVDDPEEDIYYHDAVIDPFDGPLSGFNGMGGFDQSGQGDANAAFFSQMAMMGDLIFGKCLKDFDITTFMENPFDTMGSYCTAEEAVKFNDALDEYETCFGVDLKEFIETIGSSSLGIALNCGGYILDQVKNGLDISSFALGDVAMSIPLPRVPQECVDSLIGDNPFGNFILEDSLLPEVDIKCFTKLVAKLPDCTLNEWPVPIVASWWKTAACIAPIMSVSADLKLLADQQARSALQSLSTCLPDEISEDKCMDIMDSCTKKADDPVFLMFLPAPFGSPPLVAPPFNQIAYAKGNEDFASAMERYEQYRNACIPAEDRAIWSRTPTTEKTISYKVSIGSVDDDGEVHETASVLLSTEEKVAANPEGGNSSNLFFPGLIVGVVIAFAALSIHGKLRGAKHRRSTSSYNELELSSNQHDFA